MPRPVALSHWTLNWSVRARVLIADILAAAPDAIMTVHHIGSTAVLGLAAKPVIDLLGETGSLAMTDAARPALEALCYRWRGENGVVGRRYFTMDDPETGQRAVHLHVHAVNDPMIAWHLAFRDRLRADRVVAAAYEGEKRRCAALHPDDSAAYAACKMAWTNGMAADAVRDVR